MISSHIRCLLRAIRLAKITKHSELPSETMQYQYIQYSLIPCCDIVIWERGLCACIDYGAGRREKENTLYSTREWRQLRGLLPPPDMQHPGGQLNRMIG